MNAIKFAMKAGIVVILVLGVQRCIGCVEEEDERAMSRRARFLVGVENEIEACERAGFERPVWRFAYFNHASFHCTDENGVLQPVLAPEHASFRRLENGAGDLLQTEDLITPSPADAEAYKTDEERALAKAEYAACAKANLVQPVWRFEVNGGAPTFYCASKSGALYPVLVPETARRGARDRVSHRGKAKHSPF